MPVSMLTTSDNPYDPFDSFDQWYMYDELHGYHTCSLLARFAITSSDMVDEDVSSENDRAIDEIIDLLPFYKKVTRTIA